MSEIDELRRHVKRLMSAPPYAPLSMDEIQRIANRRRRSGRRIRCLVAVATTLSIVAAVLVRLPQGTDRVVTIVTIAPTTTSVRSVARSTTISDLRFQPIASPADDTGQAVLQIFAIADRFVAVDNTQNVRRAWERTVDSEWRPVALAKELLGTTIGSMHAVAGRIVVAASRENQVGAAADVIMTGSTLNDLRVEPASSQVRLPPTRPFEGVPEGDWVVTAGNPERFAFGPKEFVGVGRVHAQLNVDRLPKGTAQILRTRPSRVDVRDGRVIVSDASGVVFDQRGSDLGITPKELDFLTRPDSQRTRLGAWAAEYGKALRQLEPDGLPANPTGFDNFWIQTTAHGYALLGTLASGSTIWISADGRSWRLTSQQAPVSAEPGIEQLGTRWVAFDAQRPLFSDDEGRTWKPATAVGRSPSQTGDIKLSSATGSPGFGMLGSSSSLSQDLQTAFPGRIVYSPAGDVWTSVPFADVGIAPSAPTIVVNDHGALISVFVPGKPLQLILATLVASGRDS